MKKAVTIVEIAKMLRMSVSTVSKALNDHPAIGAITKERVKAKAAELHYVPNQAARFFQQKKSFQIGVIMPSLRDSFYVEAVTGIETAARNAGYITLLCQSHEDPEREKELVKTMLLQRVDGLIVTVTKETMNLEHIREAEQIGIPVAHFVRIPDANASLAISNNVKAAAEEATNFLIGRGHTRIGHIMGPKNLITSMERMKGFRKSMEKAGLPIAEHWLQETDLSQGGNERAFQNLMGTGEKPTAVLCFKDHIALDALSLQQQRRELPGNIEFVGFGNASSLRYMNYPLAASVEEHPHRLGEEAAKRLIKRIEAIDKEEVEIPRGRYSARCELVIFHPEKSSRKI